MSEKSAKPDSAAVRAESGSTTPKEREEQQAAAKPRWIVRYRAWVRLHKHWKHPHPWRQAWIDAR